MQSITYVEVCETERQLLNTIWWNAHGIMDDIEASRSHRSFTDRLRNQIKVISGTKVRVK